MDTNNNFVEKLNYYQSANTDSKTIKQNFVIRVHEFHSIINTLSNKDWNDSLQHELILGRRGSGKSTLIKRIEIEINENKKLVKSYIPINLAEEQASIYQLHDLWFETLIELQNKLDFTLELKEFDTFKKIQDYTRYLFFEINRILEKEKRKIVLLLDNFDRILENFKEDIKLLRDFLMNYNNIQIIGGSTRINEHFWNYDKPFYDFFRQHLLKSLSFDEIHVLLNSWSKIMDKPDLKDYAINNRGKIESIRILTDGMPRTLQFFIRILLTDKEIYGFNYIKKIMDNATPLYQEKLNSLTPSQRKIVLEMAFVWEPTTTKELVNKCRMQSKLVSSYLKQLESLGVVDKLDTNNRNKKYRISERFFNMWLIVTQGNPAQKRKAKYLTIFIESWYSEHEIKDLAKEHLNTVQEGKMSYGKASVKTKALSQSRYIDLALRDSLISSTNLLMKVLDNNNLPELSSNVILKVQALINQKKFNLALKKIDEIENEEDGIAFFLKGSILYIKYRKNKKENDYLLKSLNCHLKAIEIEEKRLLIEEKRLLKDKKNIDYFNRLIGHSYNLLLIIMMKENQNYIKHLNHALDKGYIFAKFFKSIHNFSQNINKKHSLYLISEIIPRNNLERRFKLIIEIWNNNFSNIKKKLNEIFSENDKEDGLIKSLLYLEQKNLVLSYFESEKYGEELRDKYRLLYYATLILTNNIEDVNLKIPQEVLPTVNQIVAEVLEKNEFYSQPSIEE